MINTSLFLSTLFILSGTLVTPAIAQNATQDARTNSQVEGDANNVIQIPNQNNNQNNSQSNNSNEVDIDVTRIAPLVSPPNTENDLGFNFSVGVNGSETTFYMGLIYQPGRSTAHQKRIEHLNQQIKMLEVQTELAELKLKSLQGEFVRLP